MDAAETAAAIAPQLDRLRAGIARRTAEVGAPLLRPFDLPDAAISIFVLMRNTPGRSVHRTALRAAVRYLPDDAWYEGIAAILAAGLVSRDVVTLEPTSRGSDVLGALAAVSDREADQLWGRAPTLRRTLELTDTALADLPHDPERAFAVVHPPHLPPEASTGGRLAENLTALRFHRADAHAAAWAAAGHTATSIGGLTGPDREAIEADTDARAAEPYARLSADERATLLTGLADLPD